LPTRSLLGGEDVQFRMYPNGFGSLIEGWTKNIALGAGQASRAAVGATTIWIAAMAWVATSTIVGSVAWATGHSFPSAAAIAWLAMAVHGWVLLRRLGSFRWTTAALFPLPLVCFLVVFGRSAALVALKRPVRWSGRTIATQRRGA
jgi:4,4'-diaponeurosporenoate glycosyltransferase